MADFSVNATQLSAPQGAGSQVLSPVQTPQESSNMGLIGGIVDIFARGLVDTRKEKAAAQSAAVITDFNQKMDAIASAKASGEITSEKAGLLSRKLYSSALANNATETDALTKSWKAFSGGTAIGEAQSEEDARKKVRADDKAAAKKDGFHLEDDASEKTVDLTIKAHQASIAFDKQTAREMAQRAEERAITSSKDSHTKAVNELEDRARDINLRTGVHAQFGNNVDATVSAAQDAINNAKLNPEQKVAAIGMAFARLEMGMTSIAKQNPELVAPYAKIAQELKASLVVQSDTSKMSTEQLTVMKNNYEMTLLHYKQLMVNDPQMAATVAASQILPNNPTVFTKSMPVVAAWFAKAGVLDAKGNLQAPQVIGTENQTEVLRTVPELLRNPKNSPAANKEIDNTLNSILKQTGDSGNLNMKQYSELAKLYSSNEFYKAVAAGRVDQNMMDSAQHVMGKTYTDGVKQKVTEVMAQPITQVSNRSGVPSTAASKTLADTVNVTFAGNRVVLQEKGGTKVGAYQSQELNAKEAGQAITQLVQMGAHMEGNNNYEAYWEKNKHKILPGYFKEGFVVGKVINGYEYLGGNASDPANFRKVPTGGK